MKPFTPGKLAEFNDYLRDYETTPEAYRNLMLRNLKAVTKAVHAIGYGSFWSPEPKLLKEIGKMVDKLEAAWEEDKNWQPIYKGRSKDAIWVGDKPRKRRKDA